MPARDRRDDRLERVERVEMIDLVEEDVEYAGGRGASPRRLAGPRVPSRRQLTAPVPFHVRPAGEVRPAQSLCIARRPDSLSAQQYRLLRFKLKEGSDPRVIGLSSPRPAEGKTTATANLGLALAEGRRTRIMMLDLNLRAPALLGMFGLPRRGSDGVGAQLQRKRRDPEAYWDVLELGGRLHIMGGGGPTENPAPLLNSEELGRLVYDLAENYDYVVIDLPAILQVADVKIVQEQLDGLVLVCRAGVTRKNEISSALGQLGPAKVHGLLMLDVAPRYMAK